MNEYKPESRKVLVEDKIVNDFVERFYRVDIELWDSLK